MVFLGKKLWRLKIWILIFDLGLVGGWAITTQSARFQSAAVATTQMSAYAYDKDREYSKYIKDLAQEFSFEPSIVEIVDRYSRQYLAEPGSEWRLLRTPEFLTYLILSIIHVESKGDPKAIGDSGRARGLTQIWTSTARDYGQVTARQLLDPEINIDFSFKHFRQLLIKYDGNIAMTLYAWNRGPGKVDKLVAYGQRPENDYGRKVYSATLDDQLLLGD